MAKWSFVTLSHLELPIVFNAYRDVYFPEVFLMEARRFGISIASQTQMVLGNLFFGTLHFPKGMRGILLAGAPTLLPQGNFNQQKRPSR